MFKDKLKELRIQKGLTQKQLAEIIYVSRSAICKWEMGNGYPSDVNLEALCAYFSVKEDWLMERNDFKESVKKEKKKLALAIQIIAIGIPMLIYISTFLNIHLAVGDMFMSYHRFTSLVSICGYAIIIPHLLILAPVILAIVNIIMNKKGIVKNDKIMKTLLIVLTIIAYLTEELVVYLTCYR